MALPTTGAVSLALPLPLPIISAALALILAIGILLIFAGLQRSIDRRPSELEERLTRVGVQPVGPAPQQRPGRGLFGGFTRDRSANAAIDRIEAKEDAHPNSFSARLERELSQADIRLTAGEFLLISGILASVGALLGFALPISSHLLLGLLLLAAGIYGPRAYITRRRLGRQRAFNAQLPEMITLMSNTLSAGANLNQALGMVAREGPDPIGPEFRRVMREVDFGRTPEVALTNLAERMQSEDLQFMVTAINIQAQAGGKLGEMLNTIAETIRDRIKLMGDVRVLTSQQRLSGYVIALLPVAIALLLTLINPNYMLGVFQTTRWCGWTMLSFSVGMILIGFLIIRRIVNIKV
ncbi:MAG TPA: type II secretion system F family protein [Ktedonobacterales bacterium]|nr:type II secretion system F family protein [Ktedonobacterales bacterium]